MAFRFSTHHALVLAIITALFLLVPHVDALPHSIGRSRINARAAYTGPTSFQTVTTTTDSSGAVSTETCTVTLKPIVVNGQDQVEETKDCVITTGSPGASAVATTAAAAQSTPAAASGAPATQSSAAGAATQAASSTAPAASGTAPAGPPAVIVGTSEVPNTAAATSVASAAATTTAVASASATAASSSAAATGTQVSAVGANASTSAAATASAAASSQSPTAQFSLPGQKLSVLPIGLGVFAGISVIALVVVGLVTYERTKYRKAFRARKLAEAGGAPGYGGMAEARL